MSVAFLVELSEEGLRLDVLVARHIEGASRTTAQRLIRGGHVRVDGASVRAGQRAIAGQSVEVTVPPRRSLELPGEAIELSVVYEDTALVVVDKPRGMVVHPVGGRLTGTLVNALLGRYPDLEGIGDALRPGIVHRLDADTSGLIVVAKNETSHRVLSDAFRNRSVAKVYLALVHGRPAHRRGIVELPVGRDPRHRTRMRVHPAGRSATTEYRVLSSHGPLTLLEVHPITGRTHQIRVHLSALGHPIVGDPFYGGAGRPPPFRGVALHAHRLTLAHPTDGRPMSFESPMPADMRALLG